MNEESNMSNADVYAEFGGSNGAVTGSGELTEHERAMLEMDVSARDGDDAIELSSDEDEQTNEEIEVGSDEDETTDDEDNQEEYSPQTVEEAAKSIDEANTDLQEGREGLESMIQMAVTNGMPQEAVETIIHEYMENESLSEHSLKLLEQHGFTRKFVNNYVNGQKAIVERMARGLVDFVGGGDKWNGILSHLEKNDPDTLDSLQTALDNNNIKMVKTILTLTQKSISADKSNKFGKKAQRSVAKTAKPQVQAVVNTGSKGFSSQQEMVAAMSDKRYSTDAKYRAEVEARVMRSNF